MEQNRIEPKLCPFLNSPCIGEQCNVSVQMNKVILGKNQMSWECSLPSLAMIMSSLVQLQLQQQQVKEFKLPPELFKGMGRS